MIVGSTPRTGNVRLRSIALFAVGLALALALTSGTALADSPAPIEGTWNFGSGQVAVQEAPGGGFTGVVVAPVTFAGCTHPIGQLIWNITGSGTSYTGTHVWFHANCSPNPGGLSTWNITSESTQYTMTFCTAHPGSGAPNPAATPTNQVGSTICYDLVRLLAPSTTAPGVPAPAPAGNGIPTITGTPKAGDTLTCHPGAYTNNPLAFDYQWNVDGTPIVGATNATYTILKSEEGLTLTCTVRAVNTDGLGPPATSAGVYIPIPHVFRCPGATGRLHGSTLGLVTLGMTRKKVQKNYVHSSDRGKRYMDFFCLTPIGVRVGFASPKLTKTLSKKEGKKLAGRVIWASTSNGFYTVKGIRPGATVPAAKKVLKKLAGPFKIGLNNWYLAPNGSSTAVFKVRKGIIEEIGIGDKKITHGRKAELIFLKSFE